MTFKKPTSIVLIAIIAVMGVGSAQTAVLCIENDGDVSVDGAGGCACSHERGTQREDTGLSRYLGAANHAEDDCDPCVDIPLGIDATLVTRDASSRPQTVPALALSSLSAVPRLDLAMLAPLEKIPIARRGGVDPPIYLQKVSFRI